MRQPGGAHSSEQGIHAGTVFWSLTANRAVSLAGALDQQLLGPSFATGKDKAT
jgi:hypothetical protein